jgi:hypothetical protein
MHCRAQDFVFARVQGMKNKMYRTDEPRNVSNETSIMKATQIIVLFKQRGIQSSGK